MNIIADEDIERLVVARLRQDGHQVWFIGEISPGAQDDSVLDLAVQQNALLLTADKDFGGLVVRHQHPAPGVVLS